MSLLQSNHFDSHEAFKELQSVNFTEEQSKVLLQLLPQSTDATHALSHSDFYSAMDKKADKEDIKLLIQQMDKRFEAVQQQLDKKADKEDIKLLIQQMDKRFEQVDKRFEALTKRIDRLMIWSSGFTITIASVVIAIMRWA